MATTSVDKIISSKIRQTPLKWGKSSDYVYNAIIPSRDEFMRARNIINGTNKSTTIDDIVYNEGYSDSGLGLVRYYIVFSLLGADESETNKLKEKIIEILQRKYGYTRQESVKDMDNAFNVLLSTPEIIQYLETQVDTMQKQRPKNPDTFYRLVVVSTNYNPPAKRHILLVNKDINTGKYKVSIGSSQFGPNQSWYDEPYFDSEQQAQNFIDNFGNIKTKVDMGSLKAKISTKPTTVDSLKDMVLVDTICGPCYMHEKAAHFEENLKENLNMIKPSILENIEKHDVLNPKLFTDKETLKPEVKNKINDIVDEFVNMLAEDEIKINIKDIILVGSNVSYNYTKDSDLDVHIIADTENLQCPDNLYPKLYSAYRSLFNKKFNIDFYDIPVEIYVETDETPRVSNGVYSVMKDTWLKAPVQQDIPDIDMDEFNKDFQEWKDRYEEVSNSGNIAAIEQYIDDIYNLRKIGLAKGGEYDTRNLTFKEVRNLGYLDNLKELIDDLKSKELSLENEVEIVDNTDNEENIYDGELDEVLFEMISRTDREMYIQKIRQAVYDQPILQDNGLFHIYLVKEADVNDKLARLKRLDFIKNVYATPGKYDFSKIDFMTGIPSRYYTITGQIKD